MSELLVEPGVTHGLLAPGGTVRSEFTVTNLTSRPVTLQRAEVTGIETDGSCSAARADVRVTSATVEGVDGVGLKTDLRPAVFTVDLSMGRDADLACAGTRFTPTVRVVGTDDAGRAATGATTTTPAGWSEAAPPLAGSSDGPSSALLVGGIALWVLLGGAVTLWQGLRRRRTLRDGASA